MKKLFLFLTLAVLALVPSRGQGKIFSMEDVILGPYTYFSPANLSQLQWRNDRAYTWVEGNELIQETAGKEDRSSLLSLGQLNNLLAARGEDTLQRLPRLSWHDASTPMFMGRGSCYLVRPDTRELLAVFHFPGEAGDVVLSPAGNALAYTLGNQLYLSMPDGKQVRISTDSIPGVVYGQTVSRNEFGISGGIFFSPSGRSLAFYRKDERNVSLYPIVDVMQRVATPEPVRYPMAGMASEEIRVGIYRLDARSTVYLETGGPSDQYLTNLAWTPDETAMLVARLNREQDHMSMDLFDVSTGRQIRTLFEERDKRYVEPLFPAFFLPGSRTRYVWQSRRDGYNHLYLYDLEKGLIRQLTSGTWEVTGLLGADKKGRELFFASTKAGPLEQQLYSVPVAGGKITRITASPGTHSGLLSPEGSALLDTWSNVSTPRVIDLYQSDGKMMRSLLRAEDPMKDYALGEIELGSLTASDGTTPLYYRLIKPVPFDPSKKYPVIVYVYGGPHAQLVTNEWLGQSRLWQHYMAQRGYLAFTLDNRGSANRGMDFEAIIHRHLGQVEVEDQMTGVDYLRSLPWVDTTRIGVHGWSYGGFMTLSLMLRHPEVFRVGVAGGPVTDWKFYEVMYGERYMDRPEENPDGYAAADLKKLAGNLEGRLLIIHGAVDETVVWQNSLSFLRACILAGTQPDYFVYPTHPHNVRGVDRIHLMNKVSRYFDDFLK